MGWEGDHTIGDDVAGGESDFGVLDSCADTDGAFVDVEVRADAMSSAVPII